MSSAPLLRREDASVLTAQRKLLIGTGFCFTFMVAEIVGGLVAHSLAVITDAAHMFSDIAGFLVSVMALTLSSREANAEYSFGFHRAEVLGAMASIFVIWLMTGILVWQAVWRLIEPEIVEGRIMFIVSVVGILMNLVLMRVFGHNHSHGGAVYGDHGHSHGHSHAHGHGDTESASSYRPPAMVTPQVEVHEHDHFAVEERNHAHDHHGDHDGQPHEHEHGAEHGHEGCCDHDHGHADKVGHGHDHGHADHVDQGHAHDHGSSSGHAHDHEHHGHDHNHVHNDAHGHGHGHEHSHEDAHGHHGSHADHKEDSLALRAAMAHVLGDMLQSLGVCLSAALIWAFHDRWLDSNGISYWYRADPICTFLFSFLVLWSTAGTVQEAVHILMAGVPRGVDPAAVLAALHAIPNVLEVHDLHVWTLVGNKRNMWAHLTVAPGTDSTPVLMAARAIARSYDCRHTCFQVEDSGTYDKSVEGDHCFGC